MSRHSFQHHINSFTPALWLERIFPHHRRILLIRVSLIFLVLIGLFELILLALAGSVFSVSLTLPPTLANAVPAVRGVSLLILAFFLIILALDGFWNSFYFTGMRSVYDNDGEAARGVTYEVADVLSGSLDDDLTQAFVSSEYGSHIFVRLGVRPKTIASELARKEGYLSAEILSDEAETKCVRLSDLAFFIFEHDTRFENVLFDNGIKRGDFFGAVAWVQRMITLSKRSARFWGRDHLARIPGLATGWSYGGAYTLKRFSYKPSSTHTSISVASVDANDRLRNIEEILITERDANVLLVTDGDITDILGDISNAIHAGLIYRELEDYTVRILDTEQLLSVSDDPAVIRRKVRAVFSDALEAGNIILGIPSLPTLYNGLASHDIGLTELVAPLVSAPTLHVVAGSVPRSYHDLLERQPKLLEHFETIFVEEEDIDELVILLEDTAVRKEGKRGVFVTFPAVRTIAEAADQYMVGTSTKQNALDLLDRLFPIAEKQNVRVITKDLVLSHVREQTGIPVGTVEGSERKKLQELESLLSEYVVGQTQALQAVAGALRRARAGVRSQERPMGTFLFLGPTGVGKTRTAKALASVYFGGEDDMHRFDMSEYSGPDALDRLIGTSDDSSGRLTSIMREKNYGLVLLDEFEKSDVSVHDLFLQILDEGFFTDGRGERVNMRNTIIIATSNAGSDLIRQTVERGARLETVRDSVVERIIERGTYKPELINRFDGVILFSPLSKTQLREIARMLLQELAVRIEKQGYRLEITDEMVSYLVEHGYKPEFGARPMRRVMQDVIEEAVANTIISGRVAPGDTIAISESDFTDVGSST